MTTRSSSPDKSAGPVVHRAEHRVIFADTDAMGIVYYGNYMRYFEIGRAEFFREHMRSGKQYIDDDLYLVVLDAHCTYHRPALYDQVLTIETTVGSADKVRVRMDYAIRNEKGDASRGGVHNAHHGRQERPDQTLPAGIRRPAENAQG